MSGDIADRAKTTRHTSHGYVEAWCRRRLLRTLDNIREGTLVIREAGEVHTFVGARDSSCMKATVTIHRSRFYTRLAFGGTLAAAESYRDGDWTADDLTSVIRIFARNEDAFSSMDGGAARAAEPLHRACHWMRANTRRGSKRNIASHYDLGNEFFALFLDETMMYSCAFAADETVTLADASRAKLDRICRKLRLRPSDRVVEIGSGWGGFALHAAGHHGCHVTTTTISQAQYDLVRERVGRAGLENRVTVLLEDYRDLSGTYDKLVSIEMIEAVGHENYDAFFRTCDRLLHNDGLMAMQAITINDHDYKRATRTVDVIKRYIFPGGCLPSVSAICGGVARNTRMRIVDLEDITPHYVWTLARWRERFWRNADLIRTLGYNEAFMRLWNYYFEYCMGGFAERKIGGVQMVFAKPGYRDVVARVGEDRQ